jgi:hypothetical protein
MPCQTIKIGDTYAIACSRGRRKQEPACVYCGKSSTKLCDFPTFSPKTGKKLKKDCDVPMCDDCTSPGVSANVDFCKEHYPIAKAAYERRVAQEAASKYECSVCGGRPDSEGCLTHGKGCYVLSADGGGEEYIELL